VSAVLETFMEQYAPEELDPRLAVCVGTDGPLPVLKHPLLYSVPYTPQLNKILNASFKAKMVYVAEALKKKDEGRYLLMHERPYRVSKLLELAKIGYFDTVPDGGNRYWQQVGQWWIDSENVHEALPQWRVLWYMQKYRIHRSACMNDDEKAHLSTLPDLIPIWHGEEINDVVGMSWTTDYAIAKWFANRFEAGRRVYQGLAPKEKVIAFFSRRGESEVLINPRDVQEKRIVPTVKETRS